MDKASSTLCAWEWKVSHELLCGGCWGRQEQLLAICKKTLS